MQNIFSKALFVSFAVATSGGALAATAQKPAAANAAPEAKLPDNSVVNQNNNGMKTDGQTNGASADQQTNAKSELEVLQKIRRSLTSEKGLSTYAQNIKILTQGGDVVLKGPVRSADEKALVENKAAEVAGKDHVKSELQVVPR